MSNGLFSANLGNLQQVLNLRLQQHGLGSSNLANANTPGYKAQRIDFERALSSVFDSDAEAMRRTDARHIGAAAPPAKPPSSPSTRPPGPRTATPSAPRRRW